MIFVEAPKTREEIERIAAEIAAPLVFNVVPSGRSPEIDEKDLEDLGFKLAIYPGALLGPMAAAMADALAAMGAPAARQAAGPRGIFELVGLREWSELGERYE